MAGTIVFHEAALMIVATIVTANFAPCIWLVWYTRLIVSPDGVELLQFGYHLSARWDNIVGLSQAAGREGFLLAETLDSRGAERLASFAGTNLTIQGAPWPGLVGESRVWIAEQRFIPMEPFAYWLKHGDLLEVIHIHAPHLADASPPEFDTLESEDRPLPLKNKILLALILVPCITLGVLMGTDVLPDSAQQVIYSAMAWIVAASLGAYAFVNLASTYTSVRQHRFGVAASAALFFIIQLLAILVILGS